MERELLRVNTPIDKRQSTERDQQLAFLVVLVKKRINKLGHTYQHTLIDICTLYLTIIWVKLCNHPNPWQKSSRDLRIGTQPSTKRNSTISKWYWKLMARRRGKSTYQWVRDHQGHKEPNDNSLSPRHISCSSQELRTEFKMFWKDPITEQSSGQPTIISAKHKRVPHSAAVVYRIPCSCGKVYMLEPTRDR